jgi:hypothetical protein
MFVLAEFVDGASALQQCHFANGAAGQRWVEARINKLHELWPRRSAAVKLHAMKPKMGVVEQVERRKHHLVVRCPAYMEEPLAAIQPQQGVASTVEFKEFHFVGCGVGVVIGVPCVVIRRAASGVRRRVMAAWCTLCHLYSVDDVLQFLLMASMASHRCF